MTPNKINPKNLRSKCRAKEITVTELARRIGRSRPAVYFAVEKPSRYPLTYALIEEELGA